MSGSMATIAVLFGVILIAAGITMAFVTGIDLRYTGGGVVLILTGIALVWFCRPKGKFSDTLASGPERSVQKPMEPSETTKQRISRRL